MTNMPLVTIGLPVFNGENYLVEALDSLCNQDYPNIEIIISDNASADSTEQIARAAAADDCRIRYDRLGDNAGASLNYNRIVSMAEGEFFKWAAHDDVCEPTFISRCVESLNRHPNAVLSYPRTILIGAAGEVLDDQFEDGLDRREDDPLDRLSLYLPHCGEQHAIFGVIRTESLRRTRLIGKHWGGDMVALADLLLEGEFVEVPERLFRRRYHDSTSMAANQSNSDINAWFDPTRRHRPALPRTRLFWSHLQAIRRSGLPIHKKPLGVWIVASIWTRSFGRQMASELRVAVLDMTKPRRRS